MSRALITEGYLTDIADAIRAKNGSSDTYTPPQMAAAIEAIPTGGGVTVEALSVTANGTYTAPTGKAYSPVTVNVSGGGGGGSVTPVYQGLSYAFISGSDFYSYTTKTNCMLFFAVSKDKKYVIFKDHFGNRLRAAFFGNKTYADFEYYVNNGQSYETIYNGIRIMDTTNNAECSTYTPSTDGILVLMTNSQGIVTTGYCVEM